MRYLGQGYEVNVPVNGGLSEFEPERLVHAFNEIHLMNYGYTMDVDIEIVNIRLSAIIMPVIPKIPKIRATSGPTKEKPRPKDFRKVFFGDGFAETPIYVRDETVPEISLNGPAVIEEANSTTVAFPGQSVSTDEYGNLIISI